MNTIIFIYLKKIELKFLDEKFIWELFYDEKFYSFHLRADNQIKLNRHPMAQKMT